MLPTHVPLPRREAGGGCAPVNFHSVLALGPGLALLGPRSHVWTPRPAAGVQLTQAVPMKMPADRGTASLHERRLGSRRSAQLTASPGGQEAGVPPAGFPNSGSACPPGNRCHTTWLSLANDPGLAGRRRADPGLRPNHGDISELGGEAPIPGVRRHTLLGPLPHSPKSYRGSGPGRVSTHLPSSSGVAGV